MILIGKSSPQNLFPPTCLYFIYLKLFGSCSYFSMIFRISLMSFLFIFNVFHLTIRVSSKTSHTIDSDAATCQI